MDQYDKFVLDTAVKAGRILLASGAEIYRVEETIKRISRYYGMDASSSFVLSSGIFLTAENQQNEIYAQVKHIPLAGVQLCKVAEVNKLSREIEEGRWTVEEAWVHLEEIEHMAGKRAYTRMAASGLGAACFCYVAGGNIWDSLAAFAAGLLLYVFILWAEKRECPMSKIVLNIAGGFLATFLSVVLYKIGLGSNLSAIVIGAIMPLLPGVSFVTSIRELADSNYIAGSVRMLDTLIVTCGIAIGVGLVYILYHRLTGGIML